MRPRRVSKLSVHVVGVVLFFASQGLIYGREKCRVFVLS